MSFRSNRSQVLQTSLINYLPALTKTHTYNLVASLYPYPTQLVGEMAYQAEVLYTFKKGSLIGGKYGTSVNANFSTAYRPMRHTSGINPLDSTGVAYSTGLFEMSDSLYWQDINFNISKKFSKNFNVIVSYFNIQLNNDVATVTKETGIIKSNIFVLETGYKFKNKSSLRAELQALIVNRRDSLGNELRLGQGGTPVDKGDWATVVIEYTINSNWFVSVMDQYNFGNPDKQHREHHPGLFCVGGVCRPVPSSNGLTLSFTHSF